MLIAIAIIIGLVVVAGLVYIGLKEDKGRDPLQERLAQYGEREVPQSLEEIELSLSFRDRVLIPVLRRVAAITVRFTPQKQLEETRRLIELAGMAGSLEPTTFFALRVLATLALGLGAFMLFFVLSRNVAPTQAILYTVGGAAIGYFFPLLWIRSKIRKRQDGIVKALPDALDLLVICVEAGLGFDAAMGKVYEKWENDLAIAFGRVLREIQLGKGRREALKDMSDRMDVPDVTSFVAAIIQADQLGVSMATILRVQSDQMRVKRRQRAQEKAHQAPVKMMIPMVLLIFPSIWIVLLGPAAIILLGTRGTTGAFLDLAPSSTAAVLIPGSAVMPGFHISHTQLQKAHHGLSASYRWLRRGLNFATEVIFPPRCAGCDRVGDYLCRRCQNEIDALPLAAHTESHPPLRDVAATAAHQGKLQRAIWSLKYDNMPQLAAPLGHRLARRFEQTDWKVDMLVPVPLHTTRLRERGYNQSQLLGNHAASMLNIRCCPEALKRTRQTTSQVTLTAEERQRNMHDAFLADISLVSGQTILLIDDVYTTGATLAACAQALLDSGAAEVYGLTVTAARG